MQELLQTQDFSKFQALKPKLLDTVDDMLANDIARLMVMVRQEESLMPAQVVKGGAFDGTMNGPFGHGYGEGAGEGIDDVEWVVGKDKPTYDEIFYTLSPVNGKITGANAKKEMVSPSSPTLCWGRSGSWPTWTGTGCWTTRSSPWPTTSSKSSWRATSCPPTCLRTWSRPPSGGTSECPAARLRHPVPGQAETW